MKSFFSRLNGDIQASSSNESSYKFWIPSKTNVERSPPKPIPIHPDVAASQGEKRSRPVKSTHSHVPKIPLHDVPTVPLETQATHSNDMSKHTTRVKLGTSSTPYTQNHPPPSSRTPRPHEHNTRYQIPSREVHGPVHPTGARTSHDLSSKPHRGGRHESSAPVPREIWLPSTTPVVSKQEDQTKLHVQGTSEKPERYRESGDEKDRELERRGKDRGKDRREREREREWEKGHTREREREERERSRAKERERTLEKEREIARAKREHDRNLEIDQGRDRDKAERDRREQERDLDREGEKGKHRTKDRSRKESSNLTRGMERAWDSDMPYDGERLKQDERRARHRDRAIGVAKGDNRESHKERDRWLEKEPERVRDRPGGQIKLRAEATDSEQFAGRVKTSAPDRERRKDSGLGWLSDTHTVHPRKLLRKTSNTLLNQPSKVEEGESSDSSTRPKRVRQVLTKRHRGEEGGSSSKVIHSRQGMPSEILTSTKSSVVKATTVTILDDVQLPVPPTPQHMPIYLPPKESNALNSGLPSTNTSQNVASTREAEPPPRRETVKSNIPVGPPHAAENVSKPREIDVVRRPPSRGPVQSQNPIPQSTHESAYIHKPKHSQPSPTTVHVKLRTPGSSLLPEMPPISTQAEVSKESNRSLERLPDSKSKKEVEADLASSVFHKVQHGIPPQSAGAVPSRQPTVSTLPVTIDPAPPQPNSDSKAYPLLRNNVNGMPNISNQERIHVATASSTDVDSKIPPLKSSQSKSAGQESIGIAITRPSTTTGLRQSNAGKNLRHHNISFSRSDVQNSIGVLIPRPSTATAIKQTSSGPSSYQTSNATSNNKLNPLVEEAHSSMSPRPSIPRHDPIPVTNLQPLSEKGSRFSAQPYNMTPTLSKGHATLSPDDLTSQQDAPGSRKQGHIGAADLNIISPLENSVSQASTIMSPKPDNLRNATTPLTPLGAMAPSARSTTPASNFTVPQIQIQRPPTSLSTRNNSVPPALSSSSIVPQIQIHPVSEKGSRFSAQPYNSTPSAGPSLSKGHAAEVVTGREDGPGSRRQGHTNGADLNITSPPENPILQASTMLNPKPDNLRNATIPLTPLGAVAPSARSTTSASNFIAPQIQIHRPPTSLSTRNNSGPPALPSAVIAPQIQIHHLITTTGTGTGNASESAHIDGTAIPRTPGTGADLGTPDINRLGTAVLPIQVDQPQDFLGNGNKFHRPVHAISTSTSRMADGNVRPSLNERILPSHGEDSRFNNLRVGSSQEVIKQTLVNKQMNGDLAQGSPSLGFFNNAFSEALQSPVVRRSDQEDRLTMKVDGKIIYTVLETDKDDGANQSINKKTSDSLVNRDAMKNVLPKEQTEVPSVERLITRKDLHIDVYNPKEAFPPKILSERSSKSPSSPSQSRIQHPGLAEILSPSFNKNVNETPSSSTAHHQPANSPTVFAKSGLSTKSQSLLDKQRPDDKLASPKSSPSDLRHKEDERSHESPKRQLQQFSTTFFRSAYLENLLSDPYRGDSTTSNVPSSSSHPSNVLHPPHTAFSVPDGITRPSLESQVNNKKPGQSGTSFPEVSIGASGPSQVEELASRKVRPSSILDSKPMGDIMPHYRATTPLRDSTSTSRHHHSMSLPVHLVPSANVPSDDGPLGSEARPPLHHPASQTKPSHTPPTDSQLALNTTHAASDSEETILMTPSSLARSVMLKPTVSRQSVEPSASSQTARKGAGLFTMFRSKTPAHPPSQYEIWHPKKTAEPNAAPSGTLSSSFKFPEQENTSAPTPVAVPIANERPSQKSKIFTPFRYLKAKRNRAVSFVSVEAQDGTAPSTIVGSPTASMLSQPPFQPPPVRDPMKATEEWRDKEDEPHRNGKKRRQRPGVVIEAEEHPEGDHRQRPKRTRTRHIKGSSKPS